MRNTRLYRFVALSIFISGLQACHPGAGSEPAGGMENAVQEYPVLTVGRHTTTLFKDYPATIQGQQNIEIRPKIDGYIDAIYVDEGASVKKGQLLFRISAPQYEQEVRTAQANINIAQADVNAAKMQVEKVRPLVEKDIISKYELQSAQFTLEARQATLAQAQARLANARINIGYTQVHSPVNGVIGTIPYRLGSLVSSNTAQPLTTVANIGNVFAYFSINEKESLIFSRNAKGNSIPERLAGLPPVTLILSDGSEYAQKGKVETASGLVVTQTGSVSMRATFPNTGSLVQSGSTGKVRIPQTIDSAILIPQKATYELQGKRFVYLLGDSGKLSSTEVKVPDETDGQFFVVLDGLHEGDRIVLEGIDGLHDGTRVKPAAANADSVYRSLK